MAAFNLRLGTVTNEPSDSKFDRRDFLKLGAALGIGAVLSQGTATAAQAATAGPDITHGPRTRNEVALTFHGAGSTAYAKAILAEVAKANAGISVLVVGTWLKEFPEMAKVILDGGHDLGNHTMTHPVLTQLPLAKVEAEINKCDAILKKLTGHKGAWFRPSGTLKSNATIRTAAGRAGYKNCITYDVDSLDYTDQSTSATVKTVERLVKPGSIIGMHFGHVHTIKAIPLILADLQAKGLKPVTLTQLLRK